jgi:hypothetical protein
MADTGALGGLVTGTGADPDPERDRAHRSNTLGDDSLSAIERGHGVPLHWGAL